jgi:hypothetical protein
MDSSRFHLVNRRLFQSTFCLLIPHLRLEFEFTFIPDGLILAQGICHMLALPNLVLQCLIHLLQILLDLASFDKILL